jgi:hypothetical protein
MGKSRLVSLVPQSDEFGMMGLRYCDNLSDIASSCAADRVLPCREGYRAAGRYRRRPA